MNIPSTIFFVVAAICYIIDALKDIIGLQSKINWTPAGHSCVVIGVWLA